MQRKNLTLTLPEEDLEFIAEQAASDLSSLRGAHIFCTGCTSFFGKWLIEALLHADRKFGLSLRLTVLSRNPKNFLEQMPHLVDWPAFNCLAGDVTSFSVEGLAPVTHIIHAANLLNDGSKSWPRRHMDTAVDGLRHIMSVAHATGCSSVLYVSSGAAYRAEPTPIQPGDSKPVFTECQSSAGDNICEPSVYGVTKRFTEIYATALGSEMDIRVPLARCFTFAGPYMPLDGTQAMGNFIKAALSGEDIIIQGDGTPRRSYMYGADLAIWLLALLVRGRHGVPYNVGSDEDISIAELAAVVAEHSGSNAEIKILGEKTEGNAPANYLPNLSRCQQDLGLKCHFGMPHILGRTFEWLKQKN